MRGFLPFIIILKHFCRHGGFVAVSDLLLIEEYLWAVAMHWFIFFVIFFKQIHVLEHLCPWLQQSIGGLERANIRKRLGCELCVGVNVYMQKCCISLYLFMCLVLFEKRASVQVSPLVHLWSILGPSGWHMPTRQLGASMGQMLAEGTTKARLNGHIQASLKTIQTLTWRYSISLCIVLEGSCKPDISYWVRTLTCFNPWLLELLESQRDVPFRLWRCTATCGSGLTEALLPCQAEQKQRSWPGSALCNVNSKVFCSQHGSAG